MIEKPQLEISDFRKGEPFIYKCSACGQIFLPPEDRSAKEAMAELLAAFHQHSEDIHGCPPEW